MLSPHDQVNESPITKITKWFKFLGNNLHLVGCAALCPKSEVMLISNVWTWLELCAQPENCQHYSEWGGYSSQEIGLTWLDLSGINEACLIDKEARGSLEGCKQKTFSTMDWNPIWKSILSCNVFTKYLVSFHSAVQL